MPPRVVLFLALLVVPCCGRALGSYGDRCEMGADCQSGVCGQTRTGGICSERCEVVADCSAHGAMAYCDPAGLVCLQMCDTDAECAGETTCMEGFCEAGMAPP
jgi:hypothetical protein